MGLSTDILFKSKKQRGEVGAGQRQLNSRPGRGRGPGDPGPVNTNSLQAPHLVAKIGRKWLFHGALFCNRFTNTLIGVKNLFRC